MPSRQTTSSTSPPGPSYTPASHQRGTYAGAPGAGARGQGPGPLKRSPPGPLPAGARGQGPAASGRKPPGGRGQGGRGQGPVPGADSVLAKLDAQQLGFDEFRALMAELDPHRDLTGAELQVSYLVT